MPGTEHKTDFRPSPSFVAGWCLAMALAGGGVTWVFDLDWETSLAVALVTSFLLFLSWRVLGWRIQKGQFLELQLFLLRCKVLPEDYKVNRNPAFLTLDREREALMAMAAEQFQKSEKQLHATRHVLDKFVGTKGSQFASQKGIQAVWEGELTRALVLFSDVRGFTRMSEKLRTQETIRYLNRMFTEFEEIIAFSGGEINKFMGDAIMSFFPYPQDNEAQAVKKALMAALHMQDAFHQIQGTFRENYTESIHTGLGIGVAGGDVVIGNIGSARRMEFTLIGDTVNMASRLCSIAEDGQILINEELALKAEGQFRMTALDPIHLKGKSGTHRPYSVTGEAIHQGLA